MNDQTVRRTRFLVIGSGIAGLQYALLAAAHGEVLVVTKKESFESNTNYAQGGIAAVLSPLDEFELHVRDTLKAGDGLCREEVVRRIVESAPRLIDRLLDYGVAFTRQEERPDAPLSLGREGGHSRNRIVHARDLTGREVEQHLLQACRDDPRITLLENQLAIDLVAGRECGLVDHPRRIVGCRILDRISGRRWVALGDLVVLATGGCGKVYAYTSNPDIATGDGLAMAYRAGARLANLEFVQFHPTCLYHPDAKNFLISEAVRGEGAMLIDARGRRFMEDVPGQELAPRDIVARAIDRHMKETGDPCVYLDLRHLGREFVKKRFPNLYAKCAEFGIDMAGEPVPVVPAAHYMCGGVLVDDGAASSLPGLLVIGETACSGVHGANRLASNSLLEALYLAEVAATISAAAPRCVSGGGGVVPPDPFRDRTDAAPEVIVLEHDWDIVRRVMWDYVGIVRQHSRLRIALQRVRAIRETVEGTYRRCRPDADLIELRNIALLGELITLCAMSRRESRGLHYTLDHPEKLPVAVDTVIARVEEPAAWEPDA